MAFSRLFQSQSPNLFSQNKKDVILIIIASISTVYKLWALLIYHKVICAIKKDPSLEINGFDDLLVIMPVHKVISSFWQFFLSILHLKFIGDTKKERKLKI